MFTKKFQSNGTVAIPKSIRQQLPSNEVKIYTIDLNGKTVVVLEPFGNTKKPTTIYE